MQPSRHGLIEIAVLVTSNTAQALYRSTLDQATPLRVAWDNGTVCTVLFTEDANADGALSLQLF